MASDLIDPQTIAAALRKNVESWTPSVDREEVGRVIETGDGIARVAGLPRTMANELLEFPNGLLGVAFNLDEAEIGCIIFGEAANIEEGDPVKQTGRILSVPVGEGFLGRVVDALGRPIDDKGAITADAERPLELQAPNVVSRQPVKEPLYTGITAIDAMTAIGRGQRQLIIGDRQTGKTAVALDTIINQKQYWGTEQAVRCVYVAVGQKDSTVAEVVETLRENGALDYTVVVSAGASNPAPFQYVAPYAGAAIGAHWMDEGKHVLIVYDDLSKQAVAYREISLLLRRPPGREAYPGDVFYLHSRLLERAAKLSDELGGGSMTALPIIETKGGDVSAYIPTNVISITDGQIFLESELFFSGVRPAMNVGISVSRVGGSAQIKAMKKVAGRLRLDLAQYRALEAFAQFGSELDKASQQQLSRGARVVEVLKQPQYDPQPVEREVVQVYAVTGGFMDAYAPSDAKRFASEFCEYLDARHPEIFSSIRSTGDLSDEHETTLKDALAAFGETFQPTEAAPSEAGLGQGTAPDEIKPDVGWDRMSSVDEDAAGDDAQA
jgi:F-type H+/Na+-transporting ATPase subunit alpha